MDTRQCSIAVVLILTVAIAVSFLVNSILFGWEATRRSAEELKVIYNKNAETVQMQLEACTTSGGIPSFRRTDTGKVTGVDCVKK